MKITLVFHYQPTVFLIQNLTLVSKVISNLKCGKAHDTTGLNAEQLIRAHPIFPVILSKIFKLILLCKQVPAGFGHSYIVPLPKLKGCITKVMSCEDFRYIAISVIISKVFEYCFIEKFSEFISTDNKQFGFKKGWVVAMLYTLSAMLLSASLKEGIQLICVQLT